MRILYTRLAPVLLGIFVLSWFIPQTYLRATRAETSYVRAMYSPIDKDFISWKHSSSGFTMETTSGEELSDREGRMRLPLFFAADVEKWGGYPLIIDGELITMDARRFFRLQSVGQRMNSYPVDKFFMILESKPEFSSLSMPPDVMILDNDKMRFIKMIDGTEDVEKGKLFTDALIKAGLVFPFIQAANNANPMKDIDEGMFIVDSNNKLFQLIMEEGKPIVRNTGFTIEGNVRGMTMQEDMLKRDYGFIATDDALYLNKYEGEPFKLPIDYKAGLSIDIWSTALNRTFNVLDYTISGLSPTMNIAMDPEYNILKEYISVIPEEDIKRAEMVNKGLSILTPFRFIQSDSLFSGVKFRFVLSKYKEFILLGSFLAIIIYLGFFYSRYKTTKAIVSRNLLEICLCAVFGIPAALMLIVFGPITRKKI